MSRRDNMKRIFVGNLPPDVRHRDLEDLFYKYGKIAFIDLKTKRGPPFAFVEFTDYRDAEDAVRHRDGKKYEGNILRVEFPRGRERTSKYRNGGSGSSRNSAPQRRSKYRVTVKGLPPSGSWQDLKDHMREIGEVCFADVYKGGEGVVEFLNYDDMRYAIKKLNNTKFKSHEGESSYITLREDSARGDSRSRSRSPIGKRRGSPSYSPTAKRRASHSVSPSRSRSRSRSPVASRRGHNKRQPPRRGRSESRSRSPSRSRSRSRSPSRSRSASRSPSATPRSARGSSRGSQARSRSRSRSGSRSRSATPKSARGSSRGSPARSRSASRSPSRSISHSPKDHADIKSEPQLKREEKSASRSPSPSSGAVGDQRTCTN